MRYTGKGLSHKNGRVDVAVYELFYFDIRGKTFKVVRNGRAQAIRYLFEDQGIKYKDVSVDPWETWQTVYKPTAPFGLCPYMSDGDFQLAESNAILRYLGRKHGLHPTDIKESARVDMINDNLEDIRKQYADVIYSEKHEADKKKFDATLPGLLINLEFTKGVIRKKRDVIYDHPGRVDYFVLYAFQTQLNAWKYDYILKEITFADYNMFDLLDVLQEHAPSCLDKFQSLKEYHARVASRPGIKKYRDTDKFKNWKINYNEYV